MKNASSSVCSLLKRQIFFLVAVAKWESVGPVSGAAASRPALRKIQRDFYLCVSFLFLGVTLTGRRPERRQ